MQPAITWKPGTPFSKVDPERAHEALEQLREKKGGIEPVDVVNAARSSRHPLHALFEWDDEVAAEKHRMEQARNIVRSLVIVRNDVPIRVFEHAIVRAPDEETKRVYRTVEEILQDPEARNQLLRRVIGELNALRSRYSSLTELATVWDSVDVAANR